MLKLSLYVQKRLFLFHHSTCIVPSCLLLLLPHYLLSSFFLLPSPSSSSAQWQRWWMLPGPRRLTRWLMCQWRELGRSSKISWASPAAVVWRSNAPQGRMEFPDASARRLGPTRTAAKPSYARSFWAWMMPTTLSPTNGWMAMTVSYLVSSALFRSSVHRPCPQSSVVLWIQHMLRRKAIAYAYVHVKSWRLLLHEIMCTPGLQLLFNFSKVWLSSSSYSLLLRLFALVLKLLIPFDLFWGRLCSWQRKARERRECSGPSVSPPRSLKKRCLLKITKKPSSCSSTF